MLLPVLLLVTCMALPMTGSAGTPPPRAERPTYSVGDKWILPSGAYELIRIENNRYIFSAGTGYEVHLTKDLAVARWLKGQQVVEFDPPPTLMWPLEVGKWGVSRGFFRGAGSSPLSADFAWSIDAYEDVRTPAGAFKAFRIDFDISLIAFQGSKRNFKMWYAPEVGQLVKADGELSFQVVAIDRPAPAPLQIVLREPKDQAHVSSEAFVMTGKAIAGSGVSRVTVTLNGQEIARQEEKGAPPDVAINIPLRLEEGRNVLLVTATDSGGTTQQEARTLFYDKPAPPPVAAAPPPVSALPPAAPPAVMPSTPTPSPPIAPTPPPPVVAPLPPLQMTLASPGDQTRIEHESIALAGMVSGGRGVSRVVVTLNGVEVVRREERTPQRSMAVNTAIRLREGPNTLVVTATESDGTLHQEVRTVHFEKPVPLAVSMRYPEDKAKLTEESTVVAALVTSSKGIAKVSVLLNGVEVHQQAERTAPKSLVVTAPLNLREGLNAIVVTATEPDGTVKQELLTVLLDKPKVTLPPPPPPPPARNQWAVVIGIGRYESPGISRLRYSVPDAEAIHQILTGAGGFKSEHVLLLTDRTERKPTYRNLKWALGTFLARSAQKDDTVLIFFAGHGAPEVDQRGIERDGLAKYLIPSDADPDDLYSTAFPMDELQTIFGRIEAERVVVFLDACYSGAAGGRTFASKKTRAVNLDDLFLERLTRAKGRAIITASRPSEVSLEVAEFGHGLFTYYVLRGLQGAADTNRDGIVSLQELYEYVEQQVSQKARAVGGNQHPVMKGELEGVLPLVKVQKP
jgi:hypothetical protein